MIYAVEDGEFVISSYQVWRPGVYESRRAANYAFRFDDRVLQQLQDNVKPAAITFEQLQRARKEMKQREEQPRNG